MENVFQQRLENFSATVPAGAFEQIMAERKKRRDKGFFFPFKTIFSLTLIMVLSFLAGNYFLSNQIAGNQPTNNNSNLVPVTTIKTDTKTQEPTLSMTVETPTKAIDISKTTKRVIKTTTPPTGVKKTIKQSTPIITKSIATVDRVLPVINNTNILVTKASSSIANRKLAKQLSFIPKIKLKSLIPDNSDAQLTDKLQALPDECYSFGRQRFYSNYYLDLLYSPNYSLRFLSTKDPEYIGYKKAREKTEDYYYAYSAGLRLGLVAESGFSLRVGFTYSRLTEIFNHLDKNTVQEITIWEIDPITLDTTGSHTETVAGELYIKHYNTHTSFGLPVYLGYQTDGEDWVISANVGAQYNFQYKTEGRFLGTNLKPANYTIRENDPDKAFKDQIGIELLASFGVGYKITDGMQIVLEPNLRYTLNNISTPANPVEQKYLTMGIWAGLRFKL